jgi:hypothetical protein
MGLDISVFKEVDFNSFQPREGKSEEDLDELYDSMLYLYSEYNPHNQSDNIKEGFYNYPDRAFNFRAGSYSGYNLFRATLCKSVYGFNPEVIWGSPNKYKGQDFVELINFSDCEGIIGPKTSKKLLDDFIKNEENFINYLEKEPFDDYMKESYKAKYKEWMKAFEIASENGVVKFC